LKDKLNDILEDFDLQRKKLSEDDVDRAKLQSKYADTKRKYDDTVRLLNNLQGEPGDLDLAIAEANLAYAQALLDWATLDLEDKTDGPDSDDMELAQARLENAQAQVAAAQSALDDLELKAPFAGTISAVYVRANEWVNSGQPVILIGDLEALQVETTDLNEIDVARIFVGSNVTVTFDALPDIVVDGTVVRIAPKASEGSGVNYTVIIELSEIPEGLLWDMTAFVDIEVKE
jgi:HlyD family secretion protein